MPWQVMHPSTGGSMILLSAVGCRQHMDPHRGLESKGLQGVRSKASQRDFHMQF